MSISEKKITFKSSDGEDSIPPCPQITLHCSDGEDIVIEESVAMQSETIKQMIKDGCFQNSTPLPDVTSKILSKVTDYCNNHLHSTAADDALKTFDADFVNIDQDTLFALIRAAKYLNIKSLHDLTSQTVADIIKGTPEEIGFAEELSTSEKKITLKSSDGKDFVIHESVALQSQRIKDMIEDGCVDNSINVTSKILSKVTEYCKKHVESTGTDTTTADFVKVDLDTLYALIRAANYLNIKSLLRLGCQTIAGMIKVKQPEEIREFLNIKDDTLPEDHFTVSGKTSEEIRQYINNKGYNLPEEDNY